MKIKENAKTSISWVRQILKSYLSDQIPILNLIIITKEITSLYITKPITNVFDNDYT